MITKINDTQKAKPLFSNWQETPIWSCLQKIMGSIYADTEENPRSAMALLGDFCFLGGEPSKELIKFQPERKNYIIMVPQSEEWAALIEQTYGVKAKQVTRYAIKKEPDVFDKEKLQDIIRSLPNEYTLSMIDEVIFNQCRANEWSKDLVSQYKDYDMYHRLGIGVAILKEGMLVAGASSYSRYLEGIEIEIDTKEEYRRRGLAYVCGAKLILECLDRKLYPSWDAQNKWSVALSEKLGYHFDHEYVAYEVVY